MNMRRSGLRARSTNGAIQQFLSTRHEQPCPFLEFLEAWEFPEAVRPKLCDGGNIIKHFAWSRCMAFRSSLCILEYSQR